MNRKTKFFGLLCALTLLSTTMFSQWIEDKTFGFKINVPSNWSQNSYMDGTDKVYDFYSPDENAAIQLRAFDATSQFTVDLLVQVYEESMLPQGSTQQSLTYHTSKQGIPGKQGIYAFNYNGTPVSMGVFFAIQNGKGYVISAMIPTSLLESKSGQVKKVTESFTLLGNKPKTSSGSLSGLTGNKSNSQNFRVRRITLCDRIDHNNMAMNNKTEFATKTPEIFAVMEYEGYTSNDITVKWIYQDGRRVITEDQYTLSKGQGGVGVVSLTKPTNDWPVGEYWVEFSEGSGVFKEIRFFIKEGSSGFSGFTGGSLAGKYRLLSRSDGKNLVNFHYIFIRDDGFMDEKYQPKNSGSYVGGGKGTWRKSGNNLILDFDDGTSHNYSIQGDKLIRTSSDGVKFTFIKSD